MVAVKDTLDRADRRIVGVLGRWSIPALRIALGLVFLWFGALKVAGVSPVERFVERTVYWFDPRWLVPALGVVEVVIGLSLVFAVALRLVLLLFVVQMAGTFLSFIVLPHVMFQDGNVLLLTKEGEFVLKNLVLLSAGLVVGATVRSDRASIKVEPRDEES